MLLENAEELLRKMIFYHILKNIKKSNIIKTSKKFIHFFNYLIFISIC